MYKEMIGKVSDAAIKKASNCKNKRLMYLISSAFAGAYIGIGVLISFTVGGIFIGAGSPYGKIMMGIAFVIALNLVIFTGTDLFTGNNFVMTVGRLDNRVKTGEVIDVWITSWIGNFIGAIILSIIFVGAGMTSKGTTQEIFSNLALAKSSVPFLQLFCRAILCNFIVCVAVLVSFRTENDAAKVLLISLCLFAFVTSGFEHSIANMTVFSVALLEKGITSVTLGSSLYSLLVVSLGNLVGGALFVGAGSYALKGEK